MVKTMTLLDEIKSGESRTLEFKQELPQDARKWVKTIVAFANGAGGKFVIGVNNQREIIGIPKEPEFLEIGDLLRINFYRPSYTKNGDKSGDKSAINPEIGDKSAEKVPRKCRVSAEKVYRAILENPKSSNKDLCRLLGLSDRAVRNQIKLLKDEGCIIRVGSDKSGYWEVVEK